MPHTLPKTIVLIRHGEKPTSPNDPDLSDAGRQRAKMLAVQLPLLYPDPPIAALFATAESKDSNRPYETIQPLGQVLNLPIDQDFADEQHKELAKRLLHDSPDLNGTTVLICWHHEKLPALTGELGAIGAPDPWPGAVFDWIWQIDYGADGTATFSTHTQPAVPET